MIVTSKCPVCKGNKKIMGCGFIESICANCNGKGIIETVSIEPSLTAEISAAPAIQEIKSSGNDLMVATNEEIIPQVKKGRPSKDKEDSK